MLSGIPPKVAARLVASTAPAGVEGDCLLWQGMLSDGYGYVRMGRRMRRVHRLVYELLVGPIPQSLVLDHLCGVKACANPAHLEPVTQRVNAQRGRSVDVCHRGHPYDAENTYVSPSGKKHCRACARINRSNRRAPAVTGCSPGRRSRMGTTTVRGLPNGGT